MANNNAQQFVDLVRKQLYNRFGQSASDLTVRLNGVLQQTIEDMDIPDTGLLQKKTYQKTTIDLNNAKTIATFSFRTTTIKYAFFVHEGLGTNRLYGRRNYLETAAAQALQLIAYGTYNRVFKFGSLYKGKKRFKRKISK
jgi:hypothetical protein